MGVVIAFETKEPVSVVANIFAQSGEEYLVEIKRHLDFNDYCDVLCGIMDVQIYDLLENDLQTIVDQYYSCE